LTQGPPSNHEQRQSFHCTESKLAPTIDVVLAGVNIAYGVVKANEQSYSEDESAKWIASGLISGAILGATAAVGFERVKQCRAAKAQLAQRLAHPQPPPGAQLDSVIITPGTDTVHAGKLVQLTGLAFSKADGMRYSFAFRWSSSNEAVAWVTQSGLVSALAPGTVVITASANRVVGTATIVVIRP